MPKIRSRINWKLTCFTLFFLPVLLGLGFWQLERADEKDKILETWAQQQTLAPVKLSELKTHPPELGKTLSLRGRFDTAHYWLQEGKTVQGRSGYVVLARVITEAFGDSDGDAAQARHILVNRGWVASTPDRSILPDIPFSEGELSLSGSVRAPTRVALIDEADNKLAGWPHRVVAMDLDEMRKQCQCPLEPYVLALDTLDAQAFTVIPQTLNMRPEKHRGYALQWFMMAATLVILWLVTNLRIDSLTSNIKKHEVK